MKPRTKKILLGSICAGFVGMLTLGTEQTTADAVVVQNFSAVTDIAATEGTAEHPYRILEIVPNESMGMIGYMIDGCEPISLERLAVGGDAAAQVYVDQLVTPGLVSQGAVVNYAFYDALPDGAQMAGTPGEVGKWETRVNSATDETSGYSEFGYYENVGAGNGAFTYDEGNDVFSYVGVASGTHSWHATEYYLAVGTGNGDYVRTITGTDLNTCTYSNVGAGAGNFSCTIVADRSAEDCTVKDATTRYWTYRTDGQFYSCINYGYQNNDSFLQAVFGTTVKDGFVAEVVTITPDMLMGENLPLIDQADMIVMSARTDMSVVWDAYNLQGIVRSDAEKAARPTGFLGASGNDLTWEATLRIVERMASATPAAMYLQQTALYTGGNSGEYNAGKLYLMLMQYGAGVFKNVFIEGNTNLTAETYNTSDGKTTYGGVYNGVTNWDSQTFLTPYGEGVMHESVLPLGITGEVFDTILLFGDDMNFLSGFLTTMVSEVVSGDSDHPAGTNSEMFDYYQSQMGARPAAVSMADAVRYIVNGASQTGMTEASRKDKLHVLEIQPCNQFVYGSEYWQLYYMTIFPWFGGSLTEDVTVTTMTTYQFIGDITDLNSEYDLIIIGSKQDATNGANGYNDAQLGNMIYTSVGDLVTNIRNTNWGWDNSYTYANSNGAGSDAYQIKSRYSGTDITKKKYEELCDFMASGKPVVVDAGLYTDAGNVNTALVDVSSYVYALAGKSFQGGSMLFHTGERRNYQESQALKKAFTQEACEMVFAADGTGTPLAYSAVTQDTSAPVYNSRGNISSWIPVSGVIVSENYNTDTDGSGNPIMRYTFILKGSPYSTYGIRLYLDHNGDGVFNDSIKERMELWAADKVAGNTNTTLTSEEANSARVSIFDVTTQSYVWPDQLLAGHTYQLVYRVRTTERGIVPWKLEAFDQSNQSVRYSAKGYTAFRVSGSNVEKEQINVLQMNLMPNMQNETTTYVNFADKTTQTGAKFEAYLNAVEDYNVEIEFLANSAWYAEYGEYGRTATNMGYTKEVQIARWKEFLEEYDMLIIGYCDMTSFTNDDIFYEGFKEFVNQGKSVILSHDLVSDASFLYMHNTLTTENDPAIRTLAGQRRKYYIPGTNYYKYSSTMLNGTEVSLLPPDNFIVRYRIRNGYWNYLGKADFMSTAETNIPNLPVDNTNEFMDNSVRLMMSYSSVNLKKDRVLNSSITNFSWLGDAVTQYVEIANEGQITTYPYDLGTTMQVASTHVQNYQLDLEQEDGGDVTVWFNLTDAADSDVTAGGRNDGIYSSRSGDSRNNYYIYTKGNITYTGLGHRNTTLTDDEVKLFVNTMISSYREVPAVPYAKVENADASEHKGNYVLYVPLTGAESAEDTVEVELSVIDENDYNITSVRSYTLRYMDENGVPLANTIVTSAPTGSLLVYSDETKSYRVQQNGRYTFEVPCQTVLEEGEAVYYVEVSSSYYAGTKEYTTSKVTKVTVYAMPLFSLH